jgi:hypothetical protein
LGLLSEALETVEQARGHLYAFHQLCGRSDLRLQDAVTALRDSGHADVADDIERDLVGRAVLPAAEWVQAGMLRSLARAARVVLDLGLVLLALVGVTVASMDMSRFGVMAAFGAGGGLFVGATVWWSRERDVRVGDGARFAGTGLVTVFGLAGAGVLGGALLPLVVPVMLVGAMLLHEHLREAATDVLGPNEPTRPSHQWPAVPRHCDSLPASRLHELWEMLRSDESRTGTPDPHLVERRSRVLDALARCGPEGYETWLCTDAPPTCDCPNHGWEAFSRVEVVDKSGTRSRSVSEGGHGE